MNSSKETIRRLQRLILTNVADLSLVPSYLPQSKSEKWDHGQVLIATQERNIMAINLPHV